MTAIAPKPYYALLVNEENQTAIRLWADSLTEIFSDAHMWLEKGYVVDCLIREYSDGEKDEIW